MIIMGIFKKWYYLPIVEVKIVTPTHTYFCLNETEQQWKFFLNTFESKKQRLPKTSEHL